MATEAIKAVYEHGGLSPIAKMDVNLAEGQMVRIAVEPIEQPDDMLAWAAQVYENLGEEQIDLIEQRALRREDFFGEWIPS